MKNILYGAFAFMMAISLTGCFDDDSTLGGNSVGDINVTGINENYVATAYMGEILTINPVVETGMDDSDMEYTWLLLNSRTGSETEDGDVIQPVVIGNDKNLSYEVAIAPGTYQLRLVTTAKSTGYTVYNAATLTVRTTFSQGFYILKETEDGNTDVDLMTVSGEKGENLLAQINGTPLPGKPLSLTPLYLMYYIDEDTDEMETTNAIGITTENGELSINRSSDFKQVFSRDNILYDKMDDNEKPYAIFLAQFNMTMLTSKGLYGTSFNNGFSDPTSGQFGLPKSECGGSRFIYHDISSYGGGALWDERNHNLTAFDYNLTAYPLVYEDYTGEDLTQDLSGYECLHCGYNYMSYEGTGIFILNEKATGYRYMYLANGSLSGTYLAGRIRIPSGTHAANATCYGTNCISASYVYCVDGGKLYACNFKSDELGEVELRPEGIGNGESITFVCNPIWDSLSGIGESFDYLVVGTQDGGKYKLYFYETNGGAPVGSPVHVTEGTGKVKCLRFLNDNFDTFDWYSSLTYSIND